VDTVGHPLSRNATRGRALAVGLTVLAFAVAMVAFDASSRPIALWDESRVAVNALEMSQRGLSIVTTYAFRPDLYNTKPPLLIWLEAASIRVLGPNELAVRLPSLLAAAATVALVLTFAWRLTRSLFVLGLSGLTLAASPGFNGEHAGMSGDYDALLTLLATAYLLLLFDVLHHRKPSRIAVLGAGLLVAAACLTKGVAGLVPGAGVAVYVLARGRLGRLFQTPWYLAGGCLALALVGGFYLAREAAAPGYLAAVTQNELGGRFVQGMSGHVRPAYYYLEMFAQLFAFGPLFALPVVGLALPWPRTKSAAFLTYADVFAVVTVLVLTLSRTKIFWYLMPIYPVLSIAFAITARRVLQLAARWGPRWLRRPLIGPLDTRHVVLALGLTAALGYDVYYRFAELPAWTDLWQGHYGRVFAALDRAGARRVWTTDGGVANNDQLVHYTPQLRFYALAWRERGLDIRAEDPDRPPTLASGAALVSCDPSRVGEVQAMGRSIVHVRGCAAVGPASAGSG